MDVTVAICTWNRARLLDQTLDRLRELHVPAGVSWELLVVDNNCTDDTSAVLKKYSDRLPLRPLPEPKQGHSHARNCAVAAARGRILLWTDDDVLVDPNWMKAYLAAIERFPDARFYGGPVRPWYEQTPPTWVIRHFDRVKFAWALVDHGSDVRPLTPKEYPCGANLGFPLDVLKRYPFDPYYGRVGKHLSSEDETRVIEQIRAAGGEGLWVGNAVVEHFLPSDRMTTEYVAEITRWTGFYGYSDFAADAAPRAFGAPRWMWKRYFTAAATARLLSVRKGASWVDALLSAAKWRGMIDRFRHEASGGGAPR